MSLPILETMSRIIYTIFSLVHKGEIRSNFMVNAEIFEARGKTPGVKMNGAITCNRDRPFPYALYFAFPLEFFLAVYCMVTVFWNAWPLKNSA